MKFKDLILSCSPSGQRKLKERELYGPELAPLPRENNPKNHIRAKCRGFEPRELYYPPSSSSAEFYVPSESEIKVKLKSSKSRSRNSSGSTSGVGTSSSSTSSSSSSKNLNLDGESLEVENETFVPSLEESLKVGDRVVWCREDDLNEFGTVRWIGVINTEKIAGIEFDEAINPPGSGWYNKRKLFDCKPDHGGLVAIAGLILEEDFLQFSFSSPPPVEPSNSSINSSVSLSHYQHREQDSNNQYNHLISPFKTIEQQKQQLHNSIKSLSPQQKHNNSPNQYEQQRNSSFNQFTNKKYNSSQHQQHSSLLKRPEPREASFYNPSTSTDYEIYRMKPSGYLTKTSPLSKERDKIRESEMMGGVRGYLNSAPLPTIYPPLREMDVDRINGIGKGIQGHKNSCYLDATLFAMFSFSSVFDSILLTLPSSQQKQSPSSPHSISNNGLSPSSSSSSRERNEGLANEVQWILRDNIVNPLREDLYTPASNIMRLRETMAHLDDKLTSEEMDPQEFLDMLFRSVLHLDGFLSLSSGESEFFHQILCRGEFAQLPTVQQILEESLREQGLFFKRTPSPALLLQMPRFGKKFKTFRGILPNLTIDITDLVEDVPRMCVICGELAVYDCPHCRGSFVNNNNRNFLPTGELLIPLGASAYSTAFCKMCVQKTHSHIERKSHREHIKPIKYTSPSQIQSRTVSSSRALSLYGSDGIWDDEGFNMSCSSGSLPRVTMDLFAIICIETSHFVTFVKCGKERVSPWVFFDSMADRVEHSDGSGSNIPQVKLLPDAGKFLDYLEKSPHESWESIENLCPEFRRLLSDPYICLYYSPLSSMYI